MSCSHAEDKRVLPQMIGYACASGISQATADFFTEPFTTRISP